MSEKFDNDGGHIHRAPGVLRIAVLTATGLDLDYLVEPLERKPGEPDATLRERFLAVGVSKGVR